MKSALAVIIFTVCAAFAPAGQVTAGTGSPVSASEPELEGILTRLQQASQATSLDLARLRIDKWKAENDQKEQLQKVADSLSRNLTKALPGLIGEVKSSRGSVSATFRLYHNINVVYEYLNSLTDAAGSLGRKEEFDPLNRDASAVNSARQDLSTYIEQAASTMEARLRPTPTPTPAPQADTTPRKIVVDDHPKSVTPKKKKTSSPTPKASPTPK